MDRILRFAILLLAAAALPAVTAQGAWKQKTISYLNGNNGIEPQYTGVNFDAEGNIYGMGSQGGKHDDGVVFKLTPPDTGKGAWKASAIYSFDLSVHVVDGGFLFHDMDIRTPRLVFDAAGNIYGASNGTFLAPVPPGLKGFISPLFELSPPVAGKTAWTETDILVKAGTATVDMLNLVRDAKGNFYMTGGRPNPNNPYIAGDAAVFEISPPAAGKPAWTMTAIGLFPPKAGAGVTLTHLTADRRGDLFGIAGGAIFELAPPAGGKTGWTKTMINLSAAMGSTPVSLTPDGKGNLYGGTISGGTDNGGIAFKLTPPADGKTQWKQTALASFGNTDKSTNLLTVNADAAGDLYVLVTDIDYSNCPFYKLSPPAAEKSAWVKTHVMDVNCLDVTPDTRYSRLTWDSTGNLYGVTEEGGPYSYGSIYELSP
jgi:hypothetical protein